MDILNFISWIRGRRQVTSVDPAKTLIPVGLKDGRRDDEYLAGAISVEDLASQLSGDRLTADTRQLVLDPSGNLTLNTGDLTITTDPLTGDDIVVRATDRVTIQAGDKLLNNQNDGGPAYLYAGNGSNSDGTADAGNGGSIRVYAGDAGNSVSGAQAYGGNVTIRGGYTTEPGSEGGTIYIYGGSSNDNLEGSVSIGNLYVWFFDPNNGTLEFPTPQYSILPSAAGNAGMRAMINDSTVAASGNFGAIAVGGGSNIVPVFSDGNDWLIG